MLDQQSIYRSVFEENAQEADSCAIVSSEVVDEREKR
jgi:hypothetical protein